MMVHFSEVGVNVVPIPTKIFNILLVPFYWNNVLGKEITLVSKVTNLEDPSSYVDYHEGSSQEGT